MRGKIKRRDTARQSRNEKPRTGKPQRNEGEVLEKITKEKPRINPRTDQPQRRSAAKPPSKKDRTAEISGPFHASPNPLVWAVPRVNGRWLPQVHSVCVHANIGFL